MAATARPALRLTPQDEAELRLLLPQLEREIVSQFEHYLFRDQRRLDPSTWKRIKSDGDVHAYKERHVKHRDATRSARSLPKSLTAGLQQRLAEHASLPRVLVAAVVPGTLDNAMYGLSFQDTRSFQSFWLGFGDLMEDSAVVATIDSATLDDPYRFLGVVWFLRTFPLNIIQRRDFLTVAFSRIAQFSNGERIGIVGCHAIPSRDISSSTSNVNTIRGTSSILKVFRQLDATRVEMMLIHFLDSKGIVPATHHVQESIRHMMPLAASVDYVGFCKKLAWLVHQRKRRDRDDDDEGTTLGDAIEPQSSGTNDYCEGCDKKLGSLFACAGTSCGLCYRRICVRCSTRHHLVVLSTTARSPVRKAHDFCIHCSLQVRALPTLSVAQQSTQRRLSRSSHSSSGSSRGRALTTLLSADALL